jgi:hypothetical protein
MSTIDADLPENSLILGLFKPVVTMEALTDDIVMTYLQSTQDKDALLNADDLLTQIRAKCTCNLAEQDPDIMISQLVSSYLTILRKCRTAELYKDRIVRTVLFYFLRSCCHGSWLLQSSLHSYGGMLILILAPELAQECESNY